jgi:hypothetical protein
MRTALFVQFSRYQKCFVVGEGFIPSSPGLRAGMNPAPTKTAVLSERYETSG